MSSVNRAGVTAHEPPPSAFARRVRYGARAAALLFAVTAVCVFVGLLASRVNARLDVTVTREHRLSVRTQELLSRLEQPYDLVVAVNEPSLDPVAWRRTRDVLDVFSHGSDRLTVTTIDTSSERGAASFESLMKKLADRFSAAAATARRGVEQGAAQADAIAAAMEGLSASALQVREASKDEPTRARLEAMAATARVSAGNLRGGAESCRGELKKTVGPMPLAPTDDAMGLLRGPLLEAQDISVQLGREAENIQKTAEAGGNAADRAKGLGTAATAARDQAARAWASLEAIEHPTILRVARAIQQNAAALVIGPPPPSPSPSSSNSAGTNRTGVTAIDLDELIPHRLPGGETPDARFRAEELIASAIGALSSRASPIVVFVHSLPATMSPEFRDFSILMERLRLRGIDAQEWRTSDSPEPPSLSKIDAGGKRPVVYVIYSVPAKTADSAVRMGKLANAASALIAAGKNVLATATPSSLPGMGQRDPMASYLEDQLGVVMDTGRPLLRQETTPKGRAVGADHIAQAAPGEHAVSRAVGGLRTPVMWPVPISAAKEPKSGVSITPVLIIESSPDVWAESEWLDYATTWPQQPPAERMPTPGGRRDATSQSAWTVGAAVERLIPGRTGPQRVMVVGSYGWYSNQMAMLIGGRDMDPGAVFRAIGNLELFEASVYWLAGQDELIARGPSAQSLPLIPPMSAGSQSTIRWLLIAGLPVLTLLAGGAWRLLRG